MKLNRNSNIFIQENAFESVLCEIPTILSRPQCVKVCDDGQVKFMSVDGVAPTGTLLFPNILSVAWDQHITHILFACFVFSKCHQWHTMVTTHQAYLMHSHCGQHMAWLLQGHSGAFTSFGHLPPSSLRCTMVQWKLLLLHQSQLHHRTG